jgi:hypothetical protein
MNLYNIKTNNQEFYLFFPSARTYKNESKMHHNIQLSLDTCLAIAVECDFNWQAGLQSRGSSSKSWSLEARSSGAAGLGLEHKGEGARQRAGTQIRNLHLPLRWDGDRQTGTVAALRRAGHREHGLTARGGGKGDRMNADGRISHRYAVVVWPHRYELLMNRGKACELLCTLAAALRGKN